MYLEKNSFLLGRSYLISSTAIFPNILWDQHPTDLYGSLGDLITNQFDKLFYSRGGSFGFSLVAESYINFSIYGLFFVGFIFSRLLEFIEWSSKKKSIYFLISATILTNYIFFYARSELEFFVRPLTWYILIPLLLVKTLNLAVGRNKNQN